MQDTHRKLLILALCLAWTGPALAGDEIFHLRFRNETDNKVYVEILHANGSYQKSETIRSGNGHRFNFEQGCNREHIRQFVAMKEGTSTWIASGTVRMETGSSDLWECNNPSISLDCTDHNDYVSSCSGGANWAQVTLQERLEIIKMPPK